MTRVSIERIKATVAADYKVSRDLIDGGRRDREAIEPRHVAMALACELTPHSTVVIGKFFGRRDHSTIISARQKIARLRAEDVELDSRLRRLKRELAPPPAVSPEIQLEFLTGPLFDWADRRAAH